MISVLRNQVALGNPFISESLLNEECKCWICSLSSEIWQFLIVSVKNIADVFGFSAACECRPLIRRARHILVLLHSQNGHKRLLHRIPFTSSGSPSEFPSSWNWSDSRCEQFAMASAVSLLRGSVWRYLAIALLNRRCFVRPASGESQAGRSLDVFVWVLSDKIRQISCWFSLANAESQPQFWAVACAFWICCGFLFSSLAFQSLQVERHYSY